jgi:hypothetical protein
MHGIKTLQLSQANSKRIRVQIFEPDGGSVMFHPLDRVFDRHDYKRRGREFAL